MIELVKRISIFIINPIIQLMLVSATAYFIWGVVKYFLAKQKGEETATFARHIVWGIVGLTIMVSVFGIMRLIIKTVDADKYIEVTEGGDIQIDETQFQ